MHIVRCVRNVWNGKRRTGARVVSPDATARIPSRKGRMAEAADGPEEALWLGAWRAGATNVREGRYELAGRLPTIMPDQQRIVANVREQ